MRAVIRGVNPDQTRWVTPFPESFPKFRIEIKDLPKENFAKIARRYGMTPQKPEAKDYETSISFTRDLLNQQFVSAEGEETFFGQELGDNKEPYIDTMVIRDGTDGDPDRPACSSCGQVDKSEVSEALWLFVRRIAEKERSLEIKN